MKKSLFLVFAIFALVVSCDKDYNTVGSDLVNGGNYDFQKYLVEDLKAYSKNTGPVQSNNLPVNALGVYNDPFFGVTKASFVSQIELTNEGAAIGYNPEIDSVYLYVPYFVDAAETITDSDGNRTFVLDSVYNFDENVNFNLEVYENGFTLIDYDPTENYEESQKYFNNQTEVETYKGSELLNNSVNTAQNSQFFINDDEIRIYKTDGNGLYVDEDGDVLANQTDVSLRVVEIRKQPGLWLDLKNSFFQTKILDPANQLNLGSNSTSILFNNNTFKNHFKGLYFKITENSPGVGSMAMLDFSKAEIKIIFKSSFVEPTTEEPNPEKSRRELTLRMGYTASGPNKCNSINLLEYTPSPAYATELGNMQVNNSESSVNGDSKLYLKGGQGSIAYIDLFGDLDVESIDEDGNLVSGSNGVPDKLDQLRVKNWLINDAKLTFYIDQVAMSGSGQVEPERIYLFDATNNAPIVDYYADPTTSSNPKNNKSAFGGFIVREDSGDKKGIKYTIRLTEYINRIINNEDEDLNQNVRLGVCVTESINLSTNAYLLNSIELFPGPNSVSNEFVPVANVMNPTGTVLFGSNPVPGSEDKKMKLEIYYTESY